MGKQLKRPREAVDQEAQALGRAVRSRLDPEQPVYVPKGPKRFRRRALNRFRDKRTGRLKPDRSINSAFRRSWPSQDELFSTALTREVVKGIFENAGGSLNAQEVEYLEQLVDMVSALRISTHLSGFSTRDRVMQHPANRGRAFFEDPYNTASLHSRMDSARRDYVQNAMTEVEAANGSAVEIIRAGARAAIEFTLNYFTAPVTADNVFGFSRRSLTAISDRQNQRQLAERERLKPIYERLGGTLRPLTAPENTVEESQRREWGLGLGALDEEGGFPQAPPSPRRQLSMSFDELGL